MKAYVQIPNYYASHLSDFLQCSVSQNTNSEDVYCEVQDDRRLIIDGPSKFSVANGTAFNISIDGLISFDNGGTAQKIFIGFSNTTNLVLCHLGIGSVSDTFITPSVNPYVLVADGVTISPT